MSSEAVHPGHSLCLIMRYTLDDISQLNKENDDQESEVRQGLIKFILDLLAVVNEAIKQSPELMPRSSIKVVDDPSMKYEEAEEVSLVMFDPNYELASWGENRLGVHPDGSLGYVRYIHRPRYPIHVHKLLVDATGQWVDTTSVRDTDVLLNYAKWFLHGMCREMHYLQRRVDEQLKRRGEIQDQQDQVRLIRAQLREAARRSQGL